MNLGELRVQGRHVRHRVDIVRWKRTRPERITSYLSENPVRKVQIGTGDHELAGWLNTDLWPRTNQVIYVDMTEPLPFTTGSLHYLYSEHAIEHISYAKASAFLVECKRVLAPGGKLRLATPNLLNLVALFNERLTTEQQSYIDWALQRNDLPKLGDARCFVVNNFVRAWGHQFIYDPATLSASLAAAGFFDPRVVEPGSSADPVLQGLEHHGETIGEAFNRFETMVVEASA